MTGKEETSPRGRGGIGDQAPRADKLAEVKKNLKEKKEEASKS